MAVYYKYSFASPEMRKTSCFELLTERNLARISISEDQIADVKPFEFLPGTLYPEQGTFGEHHPCGGSFGVHIILKDGKDAYLYGRLSYDENVNRDHWERKPHWNYDIQGVNPEGKYLEAYKQMPWHGLPDSEYLEISIDRFGETKKFKVNRS